MTQSTLRGRIQIQKRFRSSAQWAARHVRDPFIRERERQDLRSRAAFKLQDLANRFHIFKHATSVVDLGCAPGGWCQVARRLTLPTVVIVGIDLLPVNPIPGVTLIQGDFMKQRDQIMSTLKQTLGTSSTSTHVTNNDSTIPIDVVLSDMAPNSTGDPQRDHMIQIDLCFTALDFAQHVACKKFLVKVYQGQQEREFFQTMKNSFQKTIRVKPLASRSDSVEIYMYGER